MLILSRKRNESVTVYVDGVKRAEIVMLDVRSNGRARLGIDADQGVTLVRTEIVEALQAEGDDMPRALEGLTDG